MMIIVMGLPGAGKSTVLKAAEGSGYEIINYGTMMFEIAKEKFGIEDRDKMRKLGAHEQKEVQRLVGEKIALEKGRIILDTHCSIKTEKGYLPGLPYSLLKKWDVERLVLVSAPANEIIARRKTDATRVRDEQSEESLLEHDMMNKCYLAAYSAFTGAPATIIANRNGGLEKAQAEFKGLLQ